MGAKTTAGALHTLTIATTAASLSAFSLSTIAGGQVPAGAVARTAVSLTIKAGTPIAVGSGPVAIAISPDGNVTPLMLRSHQRH